MKSSIEQSLHTGVAPNGIYDQDVVIGIETKVDDYEVESGFEIVTLGDHERIVLPLENIIRLAQVRGKANKEQGRLTESIKRRGILSPINVIRMDDTTLKDYIDFVNGVWRTDSSLDQYASQRHSDGYSYVVFGGHSRVEGVTKLQAETPDRKYRIAANVHEANSFDEVMNLQLEDNIHSTPSKEEEAVMIVEMFEYGKRKGWWDSKAGYRRTMESKHDKKIGEGVLDQALHFSELPLEIREAVFSKQIPYAVGVQLGRESETIRAHERLQLKLTSSQQTSEDGLSEEDTYRARLIYLVQGIYNHNLTGPAAVRYIDGQLNLMKEVVSLQEQEKSVVQPRLFMESPEEQGRQYLRQLREKVKREQGRAEHFSIGAVKELLRLSHMADPSADLTDLEQERSERERLFGSKVASTVQLFDAAD